jgi:hypothetical protein
VNFRLGRNKSAPDSRTLKFADYLKPEALAPAPPATNWYGNVPNWPMFGNDKFGDCTIAALCHAQDTWTTYASGVETGPTLSQALDVYHTLSPNDTGCDMLTTLKYFAKHGIGGKTIAAYCALDIHSLHQAQTAINLFGGIYFGLNLPDAITHAPDMLTIPWDVAECGRVGNPASGHAVWMNGYAHSTGYLFFDTITWAARIQMSGTAYQDWGEECYAIVSTEWIAANGTSPSGFNLAQLLLDRAAISAIK